MPESANPLNIEDLGLPRLEFQAFVNDYWAEIALCLGVVAHNHDSRYYTETEIDSMLSGKSDTSHNHDSRYYTESEIDTALSGKSDTSHTHTTSDITNLSSYTGFDSRYAPAVHNHNANYYTKSEIDTALAGLGGGGKVWHAYLMGGAFIPPVVGVNTTGATVTVTNPSSGVIRLTFSSAVLTPDKVSVVPVNVGYTGPYGAGVTDYNVGIVSTTVIDLYCTVRYSDGSGAAQDYPNCLLTVTIL